MKSNVEQVVRDVINDKMEQIIVAISASHPSAQDVKNLIEKVTSIDKKHDEAHRILNESHRVLNEKMDVINEKVTKTNGRVTKLESWRIGLEGFMNGVKVGGKGVWIGIGTTVGIGWVLFGETIKRKLGF